MTLYNVAVPVVALVEADSPEAAIKVLSQRLTNPAEGDAFEVYEEALPDGANAFESEPITCTCPRSETLTMHEPRCPVPDAVILA